MIKNNKGFAPIQANRKLSGSIRQVMLSILISVSMIACDDRPTPFDKEKWVASYDELIVEGDDRYKMMIWLERNYIFCGKTLDEILDTFFEVDYLGRYEHNLPEKIIKNKRLDLIVKQYNPNFIMGIDPWINTDWIELYFDDNLRVSKAAIVHFDLNSKKRSERIICQGHK